MHLCSPQVHWCGGLVRLGEPADAAGVRRSAVREDAARHCLRLCVRDAQSALVRLCEFTRKLELKRDRFHWRENHTNCSCAMCPDAYVSMDAVNTSSCEERNALSRRQQHHLRQMKQDQFITFTVYQQALSNAVAMHRDKATLGSSDKWPEW